MIDEDPAPQQQAPPRAGRRAAAAAAASPAFKQASSTAYEGHEAFSPPQEPQPPQLQHQEPHASRQTTTQQGEGNGEDEEADHLAPPPSRPDNRDPDSIDGGSGMRSSSSAGGGGQQGEAEAGPPSSPAPPPQRQGRTTGAQVGGFMETNDREEKGEVNPTSVPGENTNKQLTGISKRKQEQHAQAQEQKAKARSKYDDRAMDAEVLDIPELEEEGKEDLSRLVAEAPKVRTNKVQGIMELDEDMQYFLPAAGDKDIDLSMLTAVLASSEQVEEKDDIWTPETLLVQLASELNAEMEKAEGHAEAAKQQQAV